MGDRKQPSPPPGDPDYTGPPQVKPEPPPAPPGGPGCDLCGDQGPLLLRARCHLTAPLAITLDGNTLIVSCYLPACGREVARFEVQRGSLPTFEGLAR